MSWLTEAWEWYASESVLNGTIVYPHAALVNPLIAGSGAALLVIAALMQAATARRRHNEQTDADRQRRITDSFSKAVEQLGSDKIEMRLGGIYTLERISRESRTDYWTIMETLCAFVRERVPVNRSDITLSDTEARPQEDTPKTAPATDIAAVLTVVARREEKSRRYEKDAGYKLSLKETNLAGAVLAGADLCEADLSGANLSKANLSGADLADADLTGTNLNGAYLPGGNLKQARLGRANLREADFSGAISPNAPNLINRADVKRTKFRIANISRALLNLTKSHSGARFHQKGA